MSASVTITGNRTTADVSTILSGATVIQSSVVSGPTIQGSVTTGGQGIQGAPGVGFPSGGSTAQVLKKASSANYDTLWGSLSQDDITDGTTNRSYTATDRAKLNAITGTNTGDQTLNGLLPSQPGNSGRVLGTDGTNAIWTSTGAGGSSSTTADQTYTGLNTFEQGIILKDSAANFWLLGVNTDGSLQTSLYYGSAFNFALLSEDGLYVLASEDGLNYLAQEA